MKAPASPRKKCAMKMKERKKNDCCVNFLWSQEGIYKAVLEIAVRYRTFSDWFWLDKMSKHNRTTLKTLTLINYVLSKSRNISPQHCSILGHVIGNWFHI